MDVRLALTALTWPFFAAASCSSSRHAPVPKSMHSRAQLEFRKQTISACHRQLYTLQITASHRWKVLEHYLPPRRVLTFAGHSTSGSASVFGFVTHGQSFRFRHTRSKFSVSSPTKPIVSIDTLCSVKSFKEQTFAVVSKLMPLNTVILIRSQKLIVNSHLPLVQ